MGDGLIGGGAHVAGGTGGSCRVVLSQHPTVALQVHVRQPGSIGDSVLTFLIDLDLGMIRPHVALPAHLRLAGHGLGEDVA